METLKLKKGKGNRIFNGHLWIYRSELEGAHPAIKPTTVIVENHNGRFLGIGDYSPSSQIAVRLLTRKKEVIGRKFFRERIKTALELRKKLFPGEDSYRLIHSEGDLLPGLIVDKYGDYLSVQILTGAMEARKELIFDVLEEILKPEGIVEKNDVATRKLEGLEQFVRVARGRVPESITISENDLRFEVDLLKGEKSGFYFDQKLNRIAISRYSDGCRVLDVFCYSGAFALNALKYNASYAVGIDSSEKAIELAKKNSELNGFSGRCEFIKANAFNYLRSISRKQQKFDLIILDPPPFAKSRNVLDRALRGYREINLQALKALNPGGVLVTCSCSHHVSPQIFLKTIMEASKDAGKRMVLLERRGQSSDHPVLLGVPETEYLKCFILKCF